jgi:hypothetical protein
MKTIYYKLTIEDVQNVAMEELDRELTRKELMQIEDPIAENIPWYDAIASAIEKVVDKSKEDK